MARIKIAGTSGASENTIVFSKAGGHSHNGRNSSLIDSTAYSMYDFSPTFVGTEVNPDRAVRQENNRIAFEDLIKRVVNNSVLAPAGIRLEPGSLNGSLIIANTITANQLAANTITASEISAGTITANELSSNIVLINNRITSQNWNGTIQANGTIFSNGIGSAGWAITNTHAVFDSTLIRGSIAANSLLTPNLTISNTGAITSTSFNVTAGGNVTATNANITGTITSGSGSIGGWTIDTNRIYGGSTYLYSNGSMSIGSTTIASNGQITNGGYTLSSSGALTATGANVSGIINADSGTIGDWLIGGSLYAEASDGFVGSGLTIDLSPTEGIYTRRWEGSFVGAGYYTDVKIVNGSATAGIDVTGTASGAVRTTEIRSSYVKTRQVLLGAGENDLQTLLNAKANSHSHPYASDDHLHDSRYVNADGDTMSGILFGTSIDMTNNLRYGGQVYSDEAGGYAEFGAVGAPTTIGGRVFRINQVSTLWSRSLSTTGSRPVFVNDDSTLFCGATVSSLRYKNNVVNSVIDTKAFLELDVVDFYYNDEFYEDPLKKTMELGVIAEQVHEKGLIDLVRYDEIGRPDGLNDNKIPFYLLKACIDQQAEIDDLKARIQALEGV